ASHQYLDNPTGQPNGSYPISVIVTDNDRAQATAGTSVQVNNVAPTVTPAPGQTASTGIVQAFNLGSFTDPGTRDNPWAVDVDWGHAFVHPPIPTAAPGALAPRTHASCGGSTSTVTVKVTDKDGATASRTFLVTAADDILVLDPTASSALDVSGNASIQVG